MTTDEQQKLAKREEGLSESFNRWMGAPMTKLTLSLIGPTRDTPEALETLLRSAFDAGVSAGVGQVTSDLLTAMLKDRPKDEKR